MYSKLYSAWEKEIGNSKLEFLPPNFYCKIADYIRCIKEEDTLLDKKSIRVSLRLHESSNVSRMLEELLWIRYRKIIKIITKNRTVPAELLTVEETKMCETFADFAKSYKKFAGNLMEGQIAELDEGKTKAQAIEVVVPHKLLTIRFLKSIPAIMGSDMKSYGPYLAEDVASLPNSNAQILVKQGLAVLVDVS